MYFYRATVLLQSCQQGVQTQNTATFLKFFFLHKLLFPNHFHCKPREDKRKWNRDAKFVSTSSMVVPSSVSARSWECSLMTCKDLIIMFSVSSVLLEDSLSMALRRGKQTEKAGADSGATSGKKTK